MKHYYRLISEVDYSINEILEELTRQKLDNNTMVIFTTDNGFLLGEHGMSGKWYPFEESIRVPLIIRDPRMPPSKVNTTSDEFTLNIDLAPTILNAATIRGDDIPEGIQGRDIADLYLSKEQTKHHSSTYGLDKNPWRQEFYYEFTTNDGMTRSPKTSALVRHDWKLMVWPDWDRGPNMTIGNYTRLFNMKEDPKELHGVDINVQPYSDIWKEMKKRHDELVEEVK